MLTDREQQSFRSVMSLAEQLLGSRDDIVVRHKSSLLSREAFVELLPQAFIQSACRESRVSSDGDTKGKRSRPEAATMIRERSVAVVVFLLAVTTAAGCRTQQTRSGPVPTDPSPPPVEPAALEVSLGEGQTLGDPFTHENLAVYPVRSSVHAEIAEYLTLDEALKEGLIEVTEKADAEVSSVFVTNHADLPVYLMAGEVILGGKQDRVVAKDTIVPAHAKAYEVAVFCVEPHRWAGDSGHFKRSDLQASTSVRKAAQVEGDQGAVWAEVASENEVARAAPQTGTYRAGATEGRVAEAAQAYVDALLPELEEQGDAVGMVVAVDGEVVSADVYGSQSLFQKLQRKLLTAHARDAAASALQGEAVEEAPGQEAAAEFLQQAREGQQVERARRGKQSDLRVECEETVGFQTVAEPAAAGAPAEVLHETYFGRE